MAQGQPPDNVVRPSRFSGAPGGSGPDDPYIEIRLRRVEEAIDSVQHDVQALRVDVARVDGKISNLPTTFQLVFILAAFVITIFAAAFGLLKLTSLH
jgi:hypothetical protein